MTETRPGGRLAENLILFGRLLRRLGVPATPQATRDLVTALQWIDLRNRAEFRASARALYVTSKDDLPLFEAAFDWFWNGNRREIAGALELAAQRTRSLRLGIDAPDDQSGAVEGAEEVRSDPVTAALTYSPNEALRSRDFSELTDSELAEVKRFLAEMNWSTGPRYTRRWRPGKRRQIDFRRTLRANLHNGGELLQLVRRRRKIKSRPLVVLADVSGSMERYTEVLLHFLYGLTHGSTRATETFLFGTQLTRVTRPLRNREVSRALKAVSDGVPDWSGGTRIGQALKSFNFDWSRRVLGRGPVVLLISDGWDRGEIGLLRQEMARLQRSCRRLIWLNPLLGSPSYQPLTRGMQAALPYVDDFLPVHNLSSLEQLAWHLARLDEHRPARRQSPAFRVPLPADV